MALKKDTSDEEDEGIRSEFSGSFAITNGTVFTEELLNKNSAQFKALAYDSEQKINAAYSRSNLKEHFRSSKVNEFSKGSVVVHFEVFFNGEVESETAQEELVEGLLQAESDGFVIDIGSVQVTETIYDYSQPYSSIQLLSVVTANCSEGQRLCADGKTCVTLTEFCDGIQNCPDASDEDPTLCGTVCDGQFLMVGSSGSFHSKNFPNAYDGFVTCRWIIRVAEGFAIKISFETFETEQDADTLALYEGFGPTKDLTYLLSGSSPGDAWLISHQATVEFVTDSVVQRQGFKASYTAVNTSLYSRYYAVTSRTLGSWDKYIRIYSLPLTPTTDTLCLKFWYHMYGEHVQRLTVFSEQGSSITILLLKEGNYGDNWNYGQATVNITAETVLVFEALKSSGVENDIALDDISMLPGPCGVAPPEPTPVPPTINPPGKARSKNYPVISKSITNFQHNCFGFPLRSCDQSECFITEDCGGPFDLYEPNTTFKSPNYPHGYGNDASCLWTLHAEEGKNIQLNFVDVDLQMANDVLEVRDGLEPFSDLVGVLTGEMSQEFFSTSSQMTVMFFTGRSLNKRGFSAEFKTGINLGQPEPCPTGEFQCGTGACVANSKVCDGMKNCPNGFDEADCVHLIKENTTGTERLKLQVQNNLYTVCASDWNSHFSDFFCRYLGYRSGDASFPSIALGDGPFTTVSVNNGSLELKPR
ncbi:hypothetical protein DNTS_016591 [Danionella cerebrum]|uniref:CUB domain-containing protein n=1 Tax=Danionella cerebrum TaxID=2873325 RepID=A0A553REN0_9TELE|nr:hypothetical protein DNTS_016591 [Danionella translucida]